MRARYARQIRSGVRFARLWDWIEAPYRKTIYDSFVKNATCLEYRAFREYRFRHWTK